MATRYRYDRGLNNLTDITPTLIANDTGGAEDISHGVLIIEMIEDEDVCKGKRLPCEAK